MIELNPVAYLDDFGNIEDEQAQGCDWTPLYVIPEGCVLVPVDLIEAVAHIGVDFGFGEYCLEEHHIAKAREIFAMLKAAEADRLLAALDSQGLIEKRNDN